MVTETSCNPSKWQVETSWVSLQEHLKRLKLATFRWWHNDTRETVSEEITVWYIGF